jgi:hypothetical protein
MNFSIVVIIIAAFVMPVLTFAQTTQPSHPAVMLSEFIYESAPYPQCHASTITGKKRGQGKKRGHV